jgi:uncharacterized membrane protein YfcA
MTVVLLCIGLAAGVLSGMFGIGGGILIIPALVWGGAKLAHALPGAVLQRLFAVFIMVVAVGLWLEAGSA